MRVRARGRRLKSARGIIGTLVLIAALYGAQRLGLVPRQHSGRTPPSQNIQTSPTPPRPRDPTPASATDSDIARLFREKKSDEWVEVTAVVDRLLPDDTIGEAHQRFIIRLGPDLRVLVAHNTGIAERVPVKAGDTVRIRGEYEYTDKGGTLHFTHKPKFERRQAGGWIEHGGVKYE